ncbi:MAG: methionyl-tRNA formyltransferase [Verrucomicrobiae bacterium]|nr:methionyl-tRNA formyltransferase [Verrucomicrobiae bacterium]NNJ43509.1 methionyl-tRNA formyltransferase [Akkermansiaceae bacterium]
MSKHRIVFMGTGDIALPTFSAMVDAGVVALVTQPDKPVGRKQTLTAPKIKQVARVHDIPVLQPESAKDPSFLAELTEMRPDVIVVMAYGQILSQAFLDIPRVACINLHASLLPRYRGAACIQAAIDAGDSHSGITVIHVVKALDAGDIILKKELAIGRDETGGGLHDRLAALAPEALTEALEWLAAGTAPRTPQDETCVSYISKLLREDGEIDWAHDAAALERRIRAYDPWPGTSTCYTDKKGRVRRLKIFPQVKVSTQSGTPGDVLAVDGVLRIACGKGSLEIDGLQPDGARRMTAAEFLLGAPFAVGDRLGS